MGIGSTKQANNPDLKKKFSRISDNDIESTTSIHFNETRHKVLQLYALRLRGVLWPQIYFKIY